MRTLLAAAILTAAAAWLSGCGDGAVQVPTVSDLKQAVTNTVETVKQTAHIAGGIELQLDGPVSSSGCYAAIYPQSAGRPNVLEITSYNDPSAESFPSVFFHAQVTQRSPAELKGQKITGQAFVMEKAAGPVWQSPADQPAQLSITSMDDMAVEADLQCVLVNVTTGDRKEVTGKLSGSMKGK